MPLEKPFHFVTGTPISSAEMNANFDAIFNDVFSKQEVNVKLQNTLNEAKQYTDSKEEQTVTWSAILNKPTLYPPSSHTHPWDQVTSKPSLYPPENHTHPWDQVTNKPNSYPPSSHNHDGRYYTKEQVDEMLPSQIWMQPGNTPLVTSSSVATSGPFIGQWYPLKMFRVKDGGIFRVTCDVRGTYWESEFGEVSFGGRVRLQLPGSDTPISNTATGASSDFDFDNVTLDMDFSVSPGDFIVLMGFTSSVSLWEDSHEHVYNTTTTVRNVVLRGVPGGNPGIDYAVI